MSKQNKALNRAYVRIQGGLGNQMFQFAFGYTLKSLYNTQVVYFTHNFPLFGSKKVTRRNLGLRHFPKLAGLEVFQINSLFKSPTVGSRNRILGIDKDTVRFTDSSFTSQKLPLDKFDRDFIFDGYWQDWFEPENISSALLEYFAFPEENKRRYKRLIDEISQTNSIAVHIRRGDYLATEKNLNFHGACSYEYFKNGIDVLSATPSRSKLFFFSDDRFWAKEKFKHLNATFISDLDLSDFDEFMIMSHAQNLVISNSSYSWWAAILGSSIHKLDMNIVAPYPWFVGTSKWPKYGKRWALLEAGSGKYVL